MGKKNMSKNTKNKMIISLILMIFISIVLDFLLFCIPQDAAYFIVFGLIFCFVISLGILAIHNRVHKQSKRNIYFIIPILIALIISIIKTFDWYQLTGTTALLIYCRGHILWEETQNIEKEKLLGHNFQMIWLLQ